MYFLKITSIALVALFLTACAEKTKLVYIPQKCKIEIRQRPTQTNNTAKDLINILTYTEELESDLNFCIK